MPIALPLLTAQSVLIAAPILRHVDQSRFGCVACATQADQRCRTGARLIVIAWWSFEVAVSDWFWAAMKSLEDPCFCVDLGGGFARGALATGEEAFVGGSLRLRVFVVSVSSFLPFAGASFACDRAGFETCLLGAAFAGFGGLLVGLCTARSSSLVCFDLLRSSGMLCSVRCYVDRIRYSSSDRKQDKSSSMRGSN